MGHGTEPGERHFRRSRQAGELAPSGTGATSPEDPDRNPREDPEASLATPGVPSLRSQHQKARPVMQSRGRGRLERPCPVTQDAPVSRPLVPWHKIGSGAAITIILRHLSILCLRSRQQGGWGPPRVSRSPRFASNDSAGRGSPPRLSVASPPHCTPGCAEQGTRQPERRGWPPWKPGPL